MLLRLLFSGSLLLTEFQSITEATGEILTASWTNVTVGAAPVLNLVLTTGDDPLLSANTRFEIQLHPHFAVASDAGIDEVVLRDTLDGTCSVTVDSSMNKLTVQRNGDGSVVNSATQIQFNLNGVTNPSYAGQICVGNIEILDNQAQLSRTLQLPTIVIEPGSLWNAQLEFSNLLSGRRASVVVRMTLAHAIPTDGAITIYLPSPLYGSLSGVSLLSDSGLDGDLEIMSKNNAIWIMRGVRSGGASAEMQDVVFELNGVLHPYIEGPFGSSILLQTLDGSKHIIDQTYVDTSKNNLAKARVVFSSTSLQVKEGDAIGAQYTVVLSDPPYRDTTVILSVGDFVSRSQLTLDPLFLVFSTSNWSIPANVSVSAIDDDAYSGNYTQENLVRVSHTIIRGDSGNTFAGGGDVNVHISENDFPAIRLSNRFLAVIEGLRNDSYQISLTSQPSSDVIVFMKPKDSFIEAYPNEVVFTSGTWNTSKVINVVASTAISTVQTTSGILHVIVSGDVNYDGRNDHVFPQNEVQVYYEPLEMESCVIPCRAGWFSMFNASTGDSKCVGCPRGYFCSGSCSLPVACPKGTSSGVEFAHEVTACQACSIGMYAHSEGLSTCLTCPAGAFCSDPNASPQPCPSGFFSSSGETQCHECPAGNFNNESFQSKCSKCPEGYYCPKGSTNPVACTHGTYSVNSGATPCEKCPAGYACSDPTVEPVSCPIGSYSLFDAVLCTICPGGHFCPFTNQAPQICGSGYYSLPGSLSCKACPRGFACDSSTSTKPNECTLGTYNSIEGAVTCRSCPAGHSCVDVSQSPILCQPGSYSSEGDHICHACPAGSYCPDQYSSPFTCAIGTYSLGSATMCTSCGLGVTCSTDVAPVACTAGYYSVNASSPCLLCEAGNFCSSTSLPPKKCNQGTYSYSGAVSCKSCPYGYTCSTAGDLVACALGQTNNADHSECTFCPKGYECSPFKTSAIACTPGSYSLDGEGQCIQCPKGYMCATTTEAPVRCEVGSVAVAGSVECVNCPAGYYCPQPTSDPLSCPLWHYSTNGSSFCIPCPAGMDCTSASSAPITCPSGSYSLHPASACLSCPAGFECVHSGAAPTVCSPGTFSVEGQARCTQCYAGYYCPQSGQVIQLPCSVGTYTEAGATACTTCPAGMYCPVTNQAKKIACAAGTYSLGSQAQCISCPRGYMCPDVDGSQNEICAPGWFSSGGAVQCTTCPAGHACPDPSTSAPRACPNGYYSLSGAIACIACPVGYACPDSTTKLLVPCAKGTFSAGGAISCTPCPAGFACAFPNSSIVELCQPGFYSTAGLGSCIECPRGYYCDTPNELPKNCSVGYFSLRASTSCSACDPGYECPRPDQLPQPCPVGYYSEGAAANCRSCYPGYKCSLASISPTPEEDACPMGGYCNPSTSFFLCPAGTFGNVTAGESIDHACAPCTEGYFCEMGTTPLTRQICPAGFYCPEGTKRASQNPCTAGTYNPSQGQKSSDICQTCPRGSYCPTGSSEPQVCPQGYFCLEGTRAANQYPCPAGMFSGPKTGLTIASQCNECPSGSYCPEASSAPTKCPAGRYNPKIGAADLHECLDCPPGWSCPHVGQSDYVDRCAKGHYCPGKTVLATDHPCPAGTYTESLELTRSQDCTICPSRHSCLQGTGGETQAMLECGPGFFCPNGTAYPNQFPCQPGTWSPSTSLSAAKECNICPTGKYCQGGKSYIDGNCAPGHFCPLGTYSSTQFQCPSGTYTAKTCLFEPSQCDDCPPGHYCPTGSAAPIPCKAGSYASLNNTKSVGPAEAWPACITCPAGYYCIEASSVPHHCGKGNFSTSGSKTCSTCEAGFFCSSETTSAANMRTNTGGWSALGASYGTCYNGTYCPVGLDREPALELDACPPGFYCPTATPLPIICPAGTYSNFTGQDSVNDCTPTPAGYFSIAGSLEPTGVCSPGFYCPIRSTSRTQVPCPARYYLDRTKGQSEEDCALCFSGSYCPPGTAYPIKCPRGYYCRTGIAYPEPCPIGTYANASGLREEDDCQFCLPGMYCDSTALTSPRGLCDPGYYCFVGAHTSAPTNHELNISGVTYLNSGGRCPRGAYCPLGSSSPTLCPPGTFNNFTGLESANQCLQCPPGKYCETPGLLAPTGSCYPGYFCIGGAVVPTQMETPAGSLSLVGATAPTPCPPGLYNLHPAQNQCEVCPAGFYCESPGTILPKLCPIGNYCPEGTTLPVKCLPGTFATGQGLVMIEQCTPCPVGQYCDSYGLSAPSGSCFAGFVCSGASPIANPIGRNYGYVCPVGNYCPEGTKSAIPCPLGSFRTESGGTSPESCSLCPGGKHCSSTALAAPSGFCSAGYYCVYNASTPTPIDTISGAICPTGFHCPEASTAPIKCSAGTYAAKKGQDVCDKCPAGHFCDGVTTSTYANCPAGHYCPAGTAQRPFPCPVGTFSNLIRLANVTECQTCTAGFFCEKPGQVQPSGLCAAGNFCPPRSENAFGRTADDDTHVCPAGFFCPEGTYLPLMCPTGTYSNATGLKRFDDCVFCDEGAYCTGSGLVEPTGPCDGGYYCRRNNTQPDPSSGVTMVVTGTEESEIVVYFGGQVCPIGSYCPRGSVSPLLCPEGSYADVAGISTCLACPSGFFCPRGCSDYLSNECPIGHYCPESTKRATQFPCPPGSFGNRTRLQSPVQCTLAPGGTFVDGYAAMEPTGSCRSGFYCSGGSATSTPADITATGGPCLLGTNCPEGSAIPIVCNAGAYCSSTNIDAALPCKEGFYCVQGSYTATPTGQTNSLGRIGDVCTRGHYCPQGTSNPIPCIPGTYSETTQNVNASNCLPCSPGYICSTSGIVTPFEKCPAGFFCTGGDSVATQRCPKGFECPESSIKPRACPAGTFADEIGLSTCKVCPERFYCEAGSVIPLVCPQGHYCPSQTPSPTKYPCPAGSFGNFSSLASPTECTQCPPGRFCTGLPPTNTTSGECAPGFYCAGNATTAKPLDGIMGGICRGGHICYGGSAVPDPIDGITGQICNPGFYCPEGSPYQIRCPKGTYNSIEKQSFCVACPAGSYCDTNSSSPVGCPLRYYCPRGTINPVLCPNGTYGHEVGLTNAEECAPCPAGKFCLAGTVTASCTAGYYCRLRNDHPNPNAAKSDNISNSEFTWRTEAGGPCPIGHYCPEGVLDPIPCPTNSSRIQTLGAALSDCGLCPAGKSCTDGIKTIPCPTGSYCPYSVGEVPCPPGTFNGAQGKENLEDCRPCDAGKLCNRTGIIDLGGYDCPSGHFCHRGSTEPSPCPDGTYRAFAGGKSPEDCLLCIEGSFCRAGAAQPIVCDATSYCPAGSGSPVSCPGGSYCPYNSTAPFTCPEGYFCSPGVALPSICTLGHYCPRATQAQIPCPLGFRGRATPLDGAYISLYTSCEACSPGTFGSDFNRTRCDQCLEGFVCLGATTTSHPTSPEADRGYPCPPGFYCPAGSSLEIACPRGTYQPSYEGKNASACLLCPDNTYQNLEGQTTCLPCSSSAYAGTGSAKCSCAGSHRAFQMTDGYCICEPGYEFYDQNMILRSDEDGEVDCQPIVYARCSSSQVRSDNGSCVSASGKVCDAACNSGAGTFVASLGICQCNDQLDLDTVCDKKCRDEATRIVVNSSTCQLQLLDSISGKVGLFKDVDNTSGLFSKVSCLSGSNCQLHSITVASTGFIGSYELPASILDDSARRQRRLTTATASKSIANPMVCLSLGDGLYFDLSVPRSYPIYLKNSMLNTNPSFDHGAFRLIAEKVINSSLVSAFAFSFTEPGTYVFGNSLNPAAQTVVFVMKQGTSCPTEAPIVPLNERNLIALSAKRRTDDIILSPDWGLIMGLLSAFFASVVAIIGALYYFRARSWTNTYIPSASGYRAKTKHVNLACMHTKGTVLVNSTSILQHGSTAPIISDLSPTSKEQSTLDGQGSRKKSKLEHQVDSDGRSEDDMELRNLFDCLRLYHEAATKNSEIQKGDVKELVRHLQAEAIELKRLLVSTLVASDAVATLSVSDASAKDDVAETSEALPISSLSGLPRSRMVADKERILLEMVECSLQDRKHFIQKRNTMLAEVSTGLYVIEGWGTLLAELSNAIVQEMFSSIGDHTPEQTRTNENSRIEHVRAALDNLKTLLAPDPLTQTSSSLFYLIEHEKGRREVGKFILEAYQRYFLQRLALKKEADDPIGPPTFIQRILKLHDEVEKSQNKEDEAFTGLLSSLRKLGAVLPQVLVSIDDLETNFCCEFDAIREERNPDREREVQAQTRNRLNKLLKEVAAGAKKLTDSLEKEAPRTLKLQRQAQHAEGALVRAVSSVKDQSNIIDQDQRDRMLENLSTHEEANVRPLTSATDLIASKPQDDQLSRLKDLLVEPTTCLRTGKKAVPLIAAIPQLPTNVRLLHTPISVHPQIVLEREPETTVQESAAAYASSLELSYPQLTKLDKERLLDDFTLDLCTIQSSISVEETRMQAELASRQVVSKTLVEAKRTHIQRCEQEDTDTLRKQHIEEEQNLKSLFQQEEFAIEQEYLNELSVLKLKFESDIPDGDSRNFHLDLDNDTYKVDRSFPQGSATMADLSGSENESSVDDNADIIAQLNKGATYSTSLSRKGCTAGHY
ncbi:putative tyrosine-protein kinase ephrin type A/B receptor [Plasmopara halstedii]